MVQTDSAKNPVSTHSSKQAKIPPGQGDSPKTMSKKPTMQHEKMTTNIKVKALQEKLAAAKIFQHESKRATTKVVSPASRNSETASLISTDSLDEFDKPVENKPVRRSTKEYHGELHQQQQSQTVTATEYIPQVKFNQMPQKQLQQQHNDIGAQLAHQRGSLSFKTSEENGGRYRAVREYPRFIPLTMATTLARDASSWAGLPVGVLTLHRPSTTTSGLEQQELPVYVLQQRLGLMTTTEELSALGLQCPATSIVDAVARSGRQVQLRLSLFTADLLTPEEAQALPFDEVTTPTGKTTTTTTTAEAPAMTGADNWAPTLTTTTVTTTNAGTLQKTAALRLYEEEIEVFGFFE